MTVTDTLTSDNDRVFYGHPLKFNPRQHRYEWQGKLVPGVTSILRRLNKPALIQWAANCAVDYIEAASEPNGKGSGEVVVGKEALKAARNAHNVIRDAAGDVGKTVHAHAEAVLLGRPSTIPVTTEAEQKGIKAFENWLSEHKVEPIALERRILSRRFYYAGTTDFYGYIDGKLSVLDFKTSGAIYDEHWLQTTAYEMALFEEAEFAGEPVPDVTRWIIRLDKKTGKFEAKPRPWSALHEDCWVNLVELNKCLTRMEKSEA